MLHLVAIRKGIIVVMGTCGEGEGKGETVSNFEFSDKLPTWTLWGGTQVSPDKVDPRLKSTYLCQLFGGQF